MSSLAGRTAFVTAAAQGIGRATALAFAQAGARVIATDVNAAGLAQLEAPGVNTALLNVLDPAAIARAAAGSVEAAHAAFVARQPMGRLGTREEIAALAVYLASDAARFITGPAMVIDGGLTL